MGGQARDKYLLFKYFLLPLVVIHSLLVLMYHRSHHEAISSDYKCYQATVEISDSKSTAVIQNLTNTRVTTTVTPTQVRGKNEHKLHWHISDIQTKRQKTLREFCKRQYKEQPSSQAHLGLSHMYYNDENGVLYCGIQKTGITSWKRIFMALDGKGKRVWKLNKETVHIQKLKRFLNLQPHQQKWRRNMYYSFFFVRHPFERLVASYRYLLGSTKHKGAKKTHGTKILKLLRKGLTTAEYKAGEGVTFKEFIAYIIKTYKEQGEKGLDEHWSPFQNLCNLCEKKYDYIGKMETLLQDADVILREIGVDIKFPSNGADFQVKAKDIMKDYFVSLSKQSINELYEIFQNDFDAFGYSVPDYLLITEKT